MRVCHACMDEMQELRKPGLNWAQTVSHAPLGPSSTSHHLPTASTAAYIRRRRWRWLWRRRPASLSTATCTGATC